MATILIIFPFSNVCKYNSSTQTSQTTVSCGTDTYNGLKTYCSTGIYDPNNNNNLSCPGGDGPPINANYTGCGNYVLCCASKTGTIPPAPTQSPATQCHNTGGQCYFALSGQCPGGGTNKGALDCNAPTFCCVGGSIGKCTDSNIGGHCQAAQTSCTSGTVRDLALDSTCGSSGLSNEICCATNPSGSSTPGGGGGTSGGGGSNNSNNGSNPPPSCTNQPTAFALAVKLEGIGTGRFDNNNPLHPTRTAAYVRVTDESGNKVYDQSNVQFTYTNGTFNNASNISISAACGHTYTVTVKLPQYIKASNTVAYGNTTQTINLSPIQGDLVPDSTTIQFTSDNKIIGDDVIDTADYNIIRMCHDNPSATETATVNSSTITFHCPDLMNLFDFQDGGIGTDINGVSEFGDNYNLWLKGYFKANGFQ